MPIDHTTRLDARSKYRQEMLTFLTKQQESFAAFQHTRGKDDLDIRDRHFAKLEKWVSVA